MVVLEGGAVSYEHSAPLNPEPQPPQAELRAAKEKAEGDAGQLRQSEAGLRREMEGVHTAHLAEVSSPPKSYYNVVLKNSISAQIRQLILYCYNKLTVLCRH